MIANTATLTGNPPYSILSYSAGLRGCAMELSLLLPAVNGVLCRVAMSPAAGQGVVFAAAAGSHGCQRPHGRAAGRLTAVLRPGDWVHYDGSEHQVLALAGTSVRRRTVDGAKSVVLAGHLTASPGFAAVDSEPAPSVEACLGAQDRELLAVGVPSSFMRLTGTSPSTGRAPRRCDSLEGAKRSTCLVHPCHRRRLREGP
jgi:hypothetical protein